MNKSKSPLWENSTGANRIWQDTRWKSCCGTRTVPRSQQCFPESGPTYFTPQSTSHTLDHWVGPVGIHHIEEDCRVLWKARRRLQLVPAGRPRDHMPILLTLRHTLQPQRGEASTARAGIRWDLQAIADCLQKGDKRVEFLEAMDNFLRKPNRQLTHWALWVDCMRELAQTLFSLHRTSKRDDAQKRLSALRRKLVSEQALRREQVGMFGETYGQLGDFSEQHLHARHKLMSLSWQLRRWTRQSASARRTSLVSDLHRALRNGRCHWVDAAAWWEWYWGPQASSFTCLFPVLTEKR